MTRFTRGVLAASLFLAFALVQVLMPAQQASAHGCTLTPGYWKNHPDAVAPFVPVDFNGIGLASSVNEAVNILSYGGSDAYRKLLRNLLAAKLNILSGADNLIPLQTWFAIRDFLLAYPLGSDLTAAQKQQVLQWSDLLDRYNNGDPTLGPGHCS